MKLSQLVAYYNLMNEDWVNPDFDAAMHKYRAMSAVVSNHHLQFPPQSNDLFDSFNTVSNAFGNVNDALQSFKNRLRSEIESLEVAQYKHSEEFYYNHRINESPSYIFNRRLRIDSHSDTILRAKLLQLTDWRLPAMVIRPGPEKFIEHLVPMDPLYLVDQHRKLLAPAMRSFNLVYRRRLRPYTVNDYRDENPLWQLPDQQFGLVFAWNYFNYRPMSILVRYLEDIFRKLRPGGTVIFTFNDCDQEQGVLQSENTMMCYTPGKAVIKQAENLGFELMSRHNGTGDVAWLELRKPGTIQSIRGGQALAKIIAYE